MSNLPSTKRLLSYFLLGAGLTVCVLAGYTWTQTPSGNQQQGTTASAASPDAPAQQQPFSQAGIGSPAQPTPAGAEASAQDTSDWSVGELRPNGLRIKPSGRSDASAVLNPGQFSTSTVQQAYTFAQQIPETLNKLYCWCGCENRGVHRANLACFEDRMAVHCGVCRGTAEIAYRMTQQGVTDAGKIQAAVDEQFAPEQARQAGQNQ